jgi:hypothetical protein
MDSAGHRICINILEERSMLGWSTWALQEHPMSRLLAATLLLSAASVAHAHNYVPIAPDSTGGAAAGPKHRKAIYKDQNVRVSRR